METMSPPPPQVKNKAKRLVRVIKIAAPLVVLIVVAIGVVYFLQAQAKYPAKHTYDRLDSYSLADEGTGMSFNKPVELKKQFAADGQVKLSHMVQDQPASYVAAANSPIAKPLTDAELQDLANSLSNASGAYYLPSTNALRTFAIERVPLGAKINFGEAKQFTGQSIKANAWQFDLQITTKENKKLTGKAVFVARHQSYYYFMVLAPDYNWEANQTVWDQVLISLKVDQ